MTKLINSYLWRLFRNKLLYVGLAAAFIITFAGAGTESSSEQAFLMIKVLGVGIIAFTSVFVPLFLGREYSDKTIRNKFVCGYTRPQVYFASCIAVTAVVVLMTAAWLTGAVLAMQVTGGNAGQITAHIGEILLFCIAHSAFVTFFSMLIPYPAICVAIQIMIFQIGSFVAPVMLSISHNAGGELGKALIYAANAFPLGQWFSSIGLTEGLGGMGAYRAIASVAVITVFTLSGCLMFRKKNIR